jgi:hypothetical protein
LSPEPGGKIGAIGAKLRLVGANTQLFTAICHIARQQKAHLSWILRCKSPYHVDITAKPATHEAADTTPMRIRAKFAAVIFRRYSQIRDGFAEVLDSVFADSRHAPGPAQLAGERASFRTRFLASSALGAIPAMPKATSSPQSLTVVMLAHALALHPSVTRVASAAFFSRGRLVQTAPGAAVRS